MYVCACYCACALGALLRSVGHEQWEESAVGDP